jgi:hypothetical protein
MHRVSFARAFRRVTGVAPSLWRKQQRLAVAAGALAAGQESLAHVATAAGFSDQSHLCREFRDETGLTPGRFRLRMRSLQVEGGAATEPRPNLALFHSFKIAPDEPRIFDARLLPEAAR